MSEKKSLNLIRPSMLCPTTVMMPAMLAAAATASMTAEISYSAPDHRRGHDSSLFCKEKQNAFWMRFFIRRHGIVDVASQAQPQGHE